MKRSFKLAVKIYKYTHIDYMFPDCISASLTNWKAT
jgi:hypothetical protein